MKKYNSGYSSFYFSFCILLTTMLSLIACNEAGKDDEKENKTEFFNPLAAYQISAPEITKIQPAFMPDKTNVIGKPSKSVRDSLLTIVPQTLATRTGMLINKEALDAFQQMHNAAMDDGIELKIISAFRDFSHQKRIWENKWNGIQVLSGNIKATEISDPNQRALEILKYSAMPGTSRHHWGTDIDINSLNNTYFENGKGKTEYDWLRENASNFGFCQPYTPRDQRNNKGYEEEKWHWSYMPVAAVYLQIFADSVTYADLQEFDGWETAQQLNAIENYVMAIDINCISFKNNSDNLIWQFKK